MQSTRSVRPFEVVSEYAPSGDQPQAISELAARVNAGETDVVLLGATGTGKSATTAWLIEQCGFKGRSEGRAGVHDRQALVLVNRGGASGSEILSLAHTIQASVQARFGILLQPEVQVI